MLWSFRFWVAVTALVGSAACSSDPAPSDGAGGAGGTSAGAGGKSSSAGKPGTVHECPTLSRGEPHDVDLGVISGQLEDPDGVPTSAGLVQVCGVDECTQADVSDNGKLAQVVNGTRDTPTLKFGNGREWAKLLVPLTEGDNDLGTLTVVPLPAFEQGKPLVPGKSVSSGGVTLTLAGDAALGLNTLDYETEGELTFRAAPIPARAIEQLGQDFVQAYALAPIESSICPAPALSLENSSELAAGTELTLFVLGLDTSEKPWVPYATWYSVGSGQVSADGASLEFPDGVPVLTAIGVKVKE